jgi:hypothetical protein
VSGERRGVASREWSGCDRRSDRHKHSTAQHSTTQQHKHKQAHTDESFIHQDLFCMPRAHSRNSQSRAEQARAGQTAQTAQTEQSSTGAHPLFTRRRQRGSPALLRTGSCQTGGPICRETKHLADDRPGQQRSSAGITLNMKGGDVNIPWPIRGRGALETPCGFERGFLERRQKGSRRPRPDCATGS